MKKIIMSGMRSTMTKDLVKSMDAMINNSSKTLNGAYCHKTTKSVLLDLFSIIGSCDTREVDEILFKIEKACEEDLELTFKLVFYTRDIREGLGKRSIFERIIKFLANKYPYEMGLNIPNILEYGRGSDLLALMDTECEKKLFRYIPYQLYRDLDNMKANKPVSLLAKWLPSGNTNTIKSKENFSKLIKGIKMDRIHYRKIITKLRKYIKLVEHDMCSNNWDEIKYNTVPSKAMTLYRNAFEKHSPELFEQYKQDLIDGKTTINSSTLYPCDIIASYGIKINYSNRLYNYFDTTTDYDEILEQQWKALPNYVDGDDNILVVADTSGSMTCNECKPLYNALALSIYFAERNKGAFHNYSLLFSDTVQFVNYNNCTTLEDKIQTIEEHIGNTNIMEVFNIVLESARLNGIPKEDMPKAILIISDMEFDKTDDGYQYIDYHSKYKNKFEEAGYELPTIVYWNVNSLKDTIHVDDKNTPGALLVSGSSPSIFKSIMGNLNCTPYEYMLKVLNGERYNKIKIKEE